MAQFRYQSDRPGRVAPDAVGAAFCKRFAGLLLERSIMHKDVAYRVGVSAPLVSFWWSGRVTPNARQLVMLADYFDVTVDYLLGRDA